MHHIEFWLDLCSHHVGNRHAKRPAQHEVKHNTQSRQKNSEAEKKNRQRKPFNAAQVGGDFRLWPGINRLEKSFAENPMIDHRPIKEPAKASRIRGINLPAPFCRAGRSEKNQMLKTQQRLGFAVAILLL